ncbi:sulfate adenylyltransferase subunit CysD [Pseudoduganella eburnea]|uniref:Sulfate adenylyltransferase subunit 2 n=2 Tax=Massilia eburnea TaxID=1776165 RepID=A0A6L6QPT4_9BURK|nr:sulfate adenylyltransferase subunit CysD [Massilia eburnea]
MNSSATPLFNLDTSRPWDTESAYLQLQELGVADTKRTAERFLHKLDLLPSALEPEMLRDELGRQPTPAVLQWEIGQMRSKRILPVFAQLSPLPGGQACLHFNDARGARYWLPLGQNEADPQAVAAGLARLQSHIGKPLALFPHGQLSGICRGLPSAKEIQYCMLSYHAAPPDVRRGPVLAMSPHLKRLEAESIEILREAVAAGGNPCMLYSLGKDSSVMLHLARKAFYPSLPPFPLLHVDTRWKFQEMYDFRDAMVRESGMEILVHTNPEAIEKNINPFDHGSSLHTDITKTAGLKQALDQHQFDVVFGGARRDEEKSRAKERIFSFRSASHRWDPKNQRPEPWNLYNTRKNKGESVRVFPLSNWTELDIWQYIHQEGIAVVPLYFAKERPVVRRDGMWLMVDDARMPIGPDETIFKKMVRFRTLGCYPLTGAIESTANSLPEIIMELVHARNSERQGRAIDNDAAASMEKKKQEGYF